MRAGEKREGIGRGRGGGGKERGKGGGACLLWDSDVDVVFVFRGIGIRRCRVVPLGEKGSCRDTAGWVVKIVECGSSVGGELGGVDAPVDDFWVRVSERTSRSCGGGRVECAHAVGVEGRQCSVDVFGIARCDGVGALCVGLGCGIRIGVNCLPDGEEPVDVCVVEPEDRVEACIWNVTHVA